MKKPDFGKFTKTEQAIFFTIFMGPILFHLGFKTIVWPQAYYLESERARPSIMKEYERQKEVFETVKSLIDSYQFDQAKDIIEENGVHKDEYSSLILPKITLLYLSEQAAFDGFYPLDDEYQARHKKMYQWHKQIEQLNRLSLEQVKGWHYISRDHFNKKRFKLLFPLPEEKQSEFDAERYIVTKPQFSNNLHKNIKRAILDKLESFHDHRIIAGKKD